MDHSIKVLHVDDEPEFVEMAASFIEREDERFTVEPVTSPEEGLDRLADGQFDCVISDYDMPGQNGITFLETIREEYPGLPFILYTGKGTEEIASHAISAGVSDYLRKQPSTDHYTVLANRVRNLVEKHRAEHNYREIFEKFPDGVTLHDNTDGSILDANKRFCQMLGYTRDELLDLDFEALHADESPYSSEQAKEHIRRAASEGPQQFEWVDETKSGEQLPVEVSLRQTTIEGHERILAVVRGITDRKRRERELHQFRSLVENAADPMYVLDENGRIEMANAALCEVLDEPKGDLLGSHVSNFMREEDAASGTELLKTLLRQENRQSGTHEFRLKDAIDSESVYETKVVVLTGANEYTGSVGVIRNVTERKDRERRLQSERDLFDVILETSPIGISVIGSDGTLEFVNERAEAIYGRGRAEIGEFTYDDSRWDLVNETGDAIAEGETPFERVADGESISDQIVGLRRPSGERVWVSVNGAPILGDDSTLEKAVFAFEDITEQRELEARLTEILGRITDAFYALDDEFRFTLVNERAEELLQASEEELLGEVLWEQYPEAAEVDEVWEAFQDAMETQTPQSYELYFEPLEFLVEANVFPSETGVSVYFSDVTEHREREEQLARQNQRLEEFASIISHDLRNPLSVARGRLELAIEECESEHHADVDRALERMERLIENLLELGHHGEPVGEREQIVLTELVDTSWANVETVNATLDTDAEQTINADKSRLQQVFENLFRNAVEHGNQEVTVAVRALDNGFYIEDDGPGIPEPRREDVFEAGYSTGEEGIGFGLSIVNEIVEAHGWEITVTEGSDGGARFEITGVRYV